MQIIYKISNIFKIIINVIILSTLINSCELIDAPKENSELLLPTIKFLHISDIHNLPNADAIVECKNITDNDTTINFTILTGD